MKLYKLIVLPSFRSVQCLLYQIQLYTAAIMSVCQNFFMTLATFYLAVLYLY
jgi:hypothetical protein